MAVYFLRCKHVSRKDGSRVTRAAAYRSGERIRDERTSEVYDYSDRDDVVYKEVALPAELAGRDDMAWTQDRSTLWNAAEQAGRRRDSRLALECLVLLPEELTAQQRVRLVSTFARELANKYRCAVDACIHLPRPNADSRNYHAHLLITTREVTPDGLGRRTHLELAGSERRLLGIAGSTLDEYLAIRQRWAQVTNDAFHQAGLQIRLDHRSFEQQGVNREPTPVFPAKVFYAERQSQVGSAAGDAIRAAYRERVEARAKGAAELSRVIRNQQTRLAERAREDFESKAGQPKKIRWGMLTREERNARRRELYQARRAIEKADSVAEAKRRAMSQAKYQARKQRNPEALREVARQGRPESPKAHATHELSKSTSPTADESAQRWKIYRETHGPGPTAEEAARNWLAFRERERLSGPSEGQTPRTREQDLESTSRDDDDDDRKRRRQHDHDFEL